MQQNRTVIHQKRKSWANHHEICEQDLLGSLSWFQYDSAFGLVSDLEIDGCSRKDERIYIYTPWMEDVANKRG